MASRFRQCIAFFGLAIVLFGAGGCGRSQADGAPGAGQRIVSLNPSLTAILVSLGVGDRLVGVDTWSQRHNPGLAALATVGGLYHPSIEALVAVSPDLVVFVPSAEQREFHTRLSALGIQVEAFDPLRFDEVLESIERLGRITGAEAQARERTDRIRATRQAIEAGVAGRRVPRTVLILQRDPLFVVGGGNFIDEMLASVGARNIAADWDEPYPRISLEWLVAQAPEVILDSSNDAEPPEAYWSRYESLPAVDTGRIVRLPVGIATLPGPSLDEALRLLARSVHGEGLEPGSLLGGSSGAPSKEAVVSSSKVDASAAASRDSSEGQHP